MKFRLLITLFITSIIPIVGPGFDIGDLEPIELNTSEYFPDQEIGYAYSKEDLVSSFSYVTKVVGTFSFLISLNGHQVTSNEMYNSTSTVTTLKSDKLTFKKEWYYAINNQLDLYLLNTLNLINPVVDELHVTFDCGYSTYTLVTGSSYTYTSPSCYLCIKNNMFQALSYTYKFSGLDEFIECTNNNTYLEKNVLSCTSSISGFLYTLSKCVAELRIYNHPDCFIVGEKTYNRVTGKIFNVIPLKVNTSKIILGFSRELSFSPRDTYYVSYNNLLTREGTEFKNNPSYFQSSNIYLPIGMDEIEDPYIFEIVLTDVGPFKDSFIFRTTYFQLEEAFGSCYRGDYCIYQGEAR